MRERKDSRRYLYRNFNLGKIIMCYKCGEKFGPGYQCKMKQFNCMIIDDDQILSQEEEKDGIEYESAEQEGVGQVPKVSLHALSIALLRKTLSLQGLLHDQPVNILLNTWSTDSYIHYSWYKG